MGQLKTAEQDMNEAKQEFLDARDALEVNMTKLSSTVSANKGGVQALETNLSKLSSTVAGLSVGSCDCKSWNIKQYAIPDGYVMYSIDWLCNTGCNDFNALGVDGSGNGVSICKPCLGGDGTAEEIARTTKPCTPKDAPGQALFNV